MRINRLKLFVFVKISFGKNFVKPVLCGTSPLRLTAVYIRFLLKGDRMTSIKILSM
jgi:hypothetical protein